MPTAKKIEQVSKIKKLVEKSGGVYFADLSTLPARDMSELRRKLRKANIRLLVAKNRLAKRALVDAGISADLAGIMHGPTAMVVGAPEEPYAPARLLKDLQQKYKEWKFKGAFVEQALFTAEQFDTLSAMPTRPELYGQLAGVLLSPLHQLAAILEGMISGLVFALDELKIKREKETPAAAPAAPAEEKKPDV